MVAFVNSTTNSNSKPQRSLCLSDSLVVRHIFIAYKLIYLTTGVYCISVAVVSKTVCPSCNSRCVSGNSAQCCSADCAAGCFGGNDNECHVSH